MSSYKDDFYFKTATALAKLQMCCCPIPNFAVELLVTDKFPTRKVTAADTTRNTEFIVTITSVIYLLRFYQCVMLQQIFLFTS